MYDPSNASILRVSRALPQAVPDSQPVAWRGGPYGSGYVASVFPDMAVPADEGSYFTANNGQTGIATAAAPVAFSAVNPFLLVYNGASPAKAGARRIMLDYLSLLATAAGTGGTGVQFGVTLDQGNRYSTGGTDLSGTGRVFNPNGDADPTSVARVYAGNVTASAASAAVRTIVGNRWMKGAIPVAGDQYTVKFGGVDAPNAIGIATITFSLNNVPKIIVPAGWSALFHLWLPAQSAASSFAPEVGWIER